MGVKRKSSNDFSLTLARGIQVLEIFSPERKVVTTSEGAEHVKISRAVARRLLLTFTSLGYLEQIKSAFSLTEKIASIRNYPTFCKREVRVFAQLFFREVSFK